MASNNPRERESLLNMPRSMGRSHFRTQKEIRTRGKKSFPAMAKDYLKVQLFEWIWHYCKSRFGGKYKFAHYDAAGGETGIYELKSSVNGTTANGTIRISLVADWGTGTGDASAIGQLVEAGRPQYTIHLGDVYYVGTKEEIEDNMFKKVKWPQGTIGSFALNGNHEMYALGKAYFKYLLPELGVREKSNDPLSGQQASFFCLKNENWLVLGLDTGYFSVGIPIWEMISEPDCELHEKIISWLHDVVKIQEDTTRGIIILSHHQYYSQFEPGHDKPARQLSELINRPVLWLWGHEHRLAIYGGLSTKKGKIAAYGRCIGHGGMPVEEINTPPKTGKKYRVGLAFYDKRTYKTVTSKKIFTSKQTKIGYNGYADLIFDGKKLKIEYRDIGNNILVEENWQVENGGILVGKSINQPVTDDGLIVYSDNLNDAIK